MMDSICDRGRKVIALAHVEDFGIAVDPDLVVSALEHVERALALPFVVNGSGRVEDVAPADDHPCLAARVERGQGVGQLAHEPEGRLVDEQQVGAEGGTGLAQGCGPEPAEPLALDRQRARLVFAGPRLGRARQLHVIEAGRHRQAVDHGRTGDE